VKFFHSFPRPRRVSTEDRRARLTPPATRNDLAFLILEAILKYGLVCTPERLKLYPDEQTENPAKLALLRAGKPDYLHVQSRFCMTLCDEAELFSRKIKGLVPGEDGPIRTGNDRTSHAALFGPWSISFDTRASRQIGVVPTTYFSPNHIFGGRFQIGGSTAPGLGLQIIQRLRELRELMIILAHIEQSVEVNDDLLVNVNILKSLNLDLPFEPEIMKRILALSLESRTELLGFFSTDRESAVNLVGFIDMMLSLFQETDSTIDGEEHAFFQQREWRLIHHMRWGTIWYCLGDQPHIRNPLANAREREVAYLRNLLEKGAESSRSEAYFKHCWVLEEVDGKKISQYIRSIVVPNRYLKRVRQLIRSVGVEADVVPAEEFGFVEQ
jgi:hypothetical protein